MYVNDTCTYLHVCKGYMYLYACICMHIEDTSYMISACMQRIHAPTIICKYGSIL